MTTYNSGIFVIFYGLDSALTVSCGDQTSVSGYLSSSAVFAFLSAMKKLVDEKVLNIVWLQCWRTFAAYFDDFVVSTEVLLLLADW